MKLTIHKNKHRPAGWWKLLRVWYNKTIITRKVRFDFTAKYDLDGTAEDADVNKLFGIGYFWNHHKDSARFGWNFNNDTNKVSLFAYVYVDGERGFLKLCEIERSVMYICSIQLMPDGYVFRVIDSRNQYVKSSFFVGHNHKKKWSYWLGLFFGGNRPAPHSITVEISK